MSVDVFGRQLTRKSWAKSGLPGSRGPPGDGFKFTIDGQYDIDNKRLCNLADPVEQNDAVSLKVMQNVIQQEIRLLYQVTSSMRSSIDDHDIMIRSLESDYKSHLQQQRINHETLQDLAIHNSQLIAHLDETLKTLERVFRTASEDNKLLIKSLESSVREDLKRLDIDTKADQELTLRNSQVIALLDKRLSAVERT